MNDTLKVSFDFDLRTAQTSVADDLMKVIFQLSPGIRADLFGGIKTIVDVMYQMALDDIQLQAEGMGDVTKAH